MRFVHHNYWMRPEVATNFPIHRRLWLSLTNSPLSEAGSERVFSLAKGVFTDLRSLLGAEQLAATVVCRMANGPLKITDEDILSHYEQANAVSRGTVDDEDDCP